MFYGGEGKKRRCKKKSPCQPDTIVIIIRNSIYFHLIPTNTCLCRRTRESTLTIEAQVPRAPPEIKLVHTHH